MLQRNLTKFERKFKQFMVPSHQQVLLQGGKFHLKVGGAKSSGNAGHPIATVLGAMIIL